MKRDYFKNHTYENGYITLEATIVFSSVFFALMLILFIGMVLYQEVEVQSVAVQASERGSVIYSSRVKDMSSGIRVLEDFNHRDPYRYILGSSGKGEEEYRRIMNSYVDSLLGRRDVLGGSFRNRGNYTNLRNDFFNEKIIVKIEGNYRTPMDSIPAMFGKKGPFEVRSNIMSVAVDSPEFVRNVDIATDVIQKQSWFGTVTKGYSDIRGKLDEYMEYLRVFCSLGGRLYSTKQK